MKYLLIILILAGISTSGVCEDAMKINVVFPQFTQEGNPVDRNINLYTGIAYALAGAVSFSHGDRWGGFTSVYFFYQASIKFGKATR